MRLPGLAAVALRSVNMGTGALLGGVAPWAFALGSKMTMLAVGPSMPMGTADVFALLFLIFLTAVGATFGVLAGSLVHLVVSRTRHAGPPDRRMVAGGLALAAVLAALWGARGVDFRYRPRVIRSDGKVARLAGPSPLAPSTPATRLYARYAPGEAPLRWRDGNVQVALQGQTLIVLHAGKVVDRVSLKGLNAVDEVYAATAALSPTTQWLALEIRLSARGMRELLLVYDPGGARSHEELVARSGSALHRPLLSSAGRPGGRQDFMLELVEPVRYAAHR
jgi:hypothetical protein